MFMSILTVSKIHSYKINDASIPLFGLPVPLTEINEKKHSDLLVHSYSVKVISTFPLSILSDIL